MTVAMIVCLVTALSNPQSALSQQLSLISRPQSVTVKHYSPGIMSRVVRVRKAQGYSIPDDVDGYVSRPECSTIGQILYLKIKGSSKVYRLAQADCSQYRDKARHKAMNLVEVGWNVAKESGLYRDGKGTGTLWGK